MQLVSLNIWEGKLIDRIIGFLKQEALQTDIFCFQEVNVKSFQEITVCLTEFKAHITETGVALFVRNDWQINDYQVTRIYRGGEPYPGGLLTHPRDVQTIVIQKGDQSYWICNVHGLPSAPPQDDSPARLQQSAQIISLAKAQSNPVIICGDFNVLPNTQTLVMFEEVGFGNLNTKYNINSTRSELWVKSNKIVDYAFVSSKVRVSSYHFPNIVISDHLPLILKCE